MLVEDSETDATLALEALNKGHLVNRVFHAKGGKEALSFLFKREQFKSVATPGLVLLDLNMPGTDGWEVIKQIRADETTREIPVVVMTSSDYDAEFHTTRGLQADGYVVKPVNLNTVIEVVKAITSFRVEIVKNPTPANST